MRTTSQNNYCQNSRNNYKNKIPTTPLYSNKKKKKKYLYQTQNTRSIIKRDTSYHDTNNTKHNNRIN